ncbi:hypothetical protein ABPG72_007700 [Tetrahymena utriculariae]
MNSSNNNWKMGNERRVNLAMTAELALNTNAGSKNISNMQYNPSVQGGGVPRVRGAGMEPSLNTNDILGTYKMQSGNGIGNSSKGFGQSEENKDLISGYKPQGTSGLPPRGYNSNNDYKNFNTGLSTNNNINNQYKPIGMGADGFGNFQTTSSNSSIQAESNGFKVQRVRGTQQQGGPTPMNNQNFQGTQTFGSGNTQNNQAGQGLGYGFARNNSKKDENVDIDQQTRQLKQEIDSLDLKLGQKNSVTNGSSNNFYQNYEQQNNAFKSSATNFGSNNNINTGFVGSGKNFYSNNNNSSDSNSNQFNSTATGAGNSVYGNNGFGISFGNANNNISNNNNFDNFGAINLNNVQSSSPQNFNSTQKTNQLNQNLNSTSNNNRLPPRGRPPVGPSAANNFEDTFGAKVDNNQQNEVRKIPVNLENLNNQNKNTNSNNNNNNNVNNNNEPKEFSTGTYDPSNILSQNRQGRMRSLGKKDANQNSHEEKAAQATGSKNLPDQEPVQEQFQCPEGCGRTFNKKALAKHIPLCKKLFQPKKEESKTQEQQKIQQQTLQQKNATDDKKQAKPPKQATKKPDSKDSKARPEQKDSSKNEALRKLKEQKKKEMMQQNKDQENGDEDLIDEPNHNEYL